MCAAAALPVQLVRYDRFGAWPSARLALRREASP